MARLITGNSRGRERAIQQRLFSRQAARFTAAIAREIRRAMNRYADSYGQVGRQAEAISDHRRRIERILEAEWTAAMETFGGRVLEAAQKHSSAMELKRTNDEYNRSVRAWIATYSAQKVTEITGTTEKQARRIIQGAVQQSVTEGLSEADTGKLIRSRVRERGGALAQGRSRMIARTETHAASQAGVDAAGKASSVPMRKEWISSRGPRTREAHDDANGQTVGLNEKFTVGGEELAYPGDPMGSAGNVINCRCVQGMVVAE